MPPTAPRPRRTHRRYNADVRKVTITLTPQTLDSLNQLFPHGQRSQFIEQAIRKALTEHLRENGAGNMPGETLEHMAATLERYAQELHRHAAQWGDPVAEQLAG